MMLCVGSCCCLLLIVVGRCMIRCIVLDVVVGGVSLCGDVCCWQSMSVVVYLCLFMCVIV